MEFGIKIIGFFLLVLRWVTAPLYYIWSQQTVKVLPPIQNPILLTSATELAKKIRKRELSSEEIIKAYIKRIKDINPSVNAVVEERFEDALKEAQEADKMIASNEKTEKETEKNHPLLGVPFSVKESCSVQGMSNCVGSLPRSGIKATKDGAAVAHLRKAGAIPILISNTPEYCLSWETSNLITGRTVNPYNVLRSSGGSSGGEAALIGAGGSVVGVGSDIAGSIRIPAMFNGIYGHKPTPGYVSIEGHFPNAEDPKFAQYLTIGPLVRYAEDMRLMLSIMAGEKAAQLRLDEKVDLKNLKIYYMDEAGSSSIVLLSVEDEIKKAIHTAVNHLNKKYGIIINEEGFKEMDDSAETSIAEFFGLEDIPNALEDYAIIHKSDESQNLLLELMKSIFGLSRFSFSLLVFYCLVVTNAMIPKSKYRYYCQHNEELKKKFTSVLGDNGVFLYPSFPTAAFYHNQSYTKAAGVMYTMIFNILGLPSTHVPLGFNKEGMPIGFQIVAGPHQDRLCLAVAEALEKDLGGWLPPSSENSNSQSSK